MDRAALVFKPSRTMSLGVELELQLVDPKTMDLSPSAEKVFDLLGTKSGRITPEIFSSMVELKTGVCEDLAAVRSDLLDAFGKLREACDELGLEIASSGTHPFAKYDDNVVYPSARYESVMDRNRWLSRRWIIFGMHVHIGARDTSHAMALMNGLLHYLPHVLALSASSPYWHGADTGLASSRVTIFEALPTAGLPCLFERWEDFESTYQAMLASQSIHSIKDIWWDVRPHPDLGTVEVRIADAPQRLSEALGIVGLVQCLAARVDQHHRAGELVRPPPMWMLRENKWRASRSSLDANVVLDETGRTRPLRDDVLSLTEELSGLARKLGCSAELNEVRRMVVRGSGDQRQRDVYDRTQSHAAVVESLVRELAQDIEELAAEHLPALPRTG